ncbi:MAG: magnesium transporter [Candidatus Heimdallarchaeota archaeon]|nr:magnesium transporter [Candidatus Heimdallarchaeota archaeon]MBY8993422.1 magnesium transporter [Candidatus Heimdallarchaeota archaeon]
MSSSSSLGKRTAVNLFFGIFLQAMIALAFDSGGIVSGTIANLAMNTQQIKWILLLYGPLLAARGDIAVLAGKLGTGLHLGTVKPTFRKNTPVYKSLVASTLTIAMLDAFLVGIVTYIMNLLIFPAEVKVLNPTMFFVIPILVMTVAALISTQITSAVSFFVYKRGLNPDVYVVPVMSTVNNILITVMLAGVLAVLKPWNRTLSDVPDIGKFYGPASGSEMIATYIAIIPAILALVGTFYIILKNRKDHEYRKMMKEAVFAVFASAIIGTITGFILTQGEEALILYPQLLVAFPALIGTLVDQNAIFANMLITDFSAGITEPRIQSFRKPAVWTKFAGIGAGGIVITAFLGLIGTFIKFKDVRDVSVVLDRPIIVLMILVMIITIIANILGFIIVGSLIYALSIFAFRREIDPDNFAIPLTACLADLACAGFIIAFAFIILPGVSGSHAEVLSNAVVAFLG